MLQFAFVVEILVMIGLPVGLWFWLSRRTAISWGLIAAGAATFVISQVVHIPLLLGVDILANQTGLASLEPDSAAVILFNATVLGLAAGLCEEVARYLVLRFWRRDARSWWQGIAFGAGHGGIESILVGLSVTFTLVSIIVWQTAGPEALGLSGEVLEEATLQMEAVLSIPWHTPLLGALERIFAITMHIAWSLLVLRALTHDNLGWLVAAVFGHAVVDGVAVGLVQAGVPYGPIEGVLFLFALAGLGVILKLRPAPSPEEELPKEESPPMPA